MFKICFIIVGVLALFRQIKLVYIFVNLVNNDNGLCYFGVNYTFKNTHLEYLKIINILEFVEKYYLVIS